MLLAALVLVLLDVVAFVVDALLLELAFVADVLLLELAFVVDVLVFELTLKLMLCFYCLKFLNSKPSLSNVMNFERMTLP
ncbi:MAG: hypothetical protein PHE78_08350 [Candidatus Gastranaerophilales bacterium]|nr:hypothetical protein [Candidatus Gastranaerophilales bacterium]